MRGRPSPTAAEADDPGRAARDREHRTVSPGPSPTRPVSRLATSTIGVGIVSPWAVNPGACAAIDERVY